MDRIQLLEIAHREIGTKEIPYGSNKVKYGEWYGLNGQKWCAMFVSWVFNNAKIPLGNIQTSKGIHHCQSAHNYYKSKGMLTSDPKPGDIVIYDWEGNGHAEHIGIFKNWTNTSKTYIEAYEGNTSIGNNNYDGHVNIRIRSKNLIKSFINPGVFIETEIVPIESILTVGSRGSMVAQIQRFLYDLSYEILVDGWFGTKTKTIVKDFQQKNLMKVNGKVDVVTFGAIAEEWNNRKIEKTFFISSSFLKKGNSGFMVVEIQRALILNEPKLKLPITGVYDNPTFLAVKDFQKESKLVVDGIVGPRTFGKLGLF